MAEFSLVAAIGSVGDASAVFSSVVDFDTTRVLLAKGDVRVVGGVKASDEERSSSAADIVGSFICENQLKL